MRFAFYVRVSTDDARNAALPRQLTTERARSPRVGGEIVTHCWPQALGAAWHRIGRRARVSVMREGGLSDLLATSANGRTFDTVIVESIDRLASAILTRTGHQPAPGAGGHEEAPAGPNPVQAPIVLMVVCCRRAQRRPRSLPAANRDRKDEMALRQTWRRSQIQAKLVPARRCAPTPRARSAGPDASTCFAAAYAARSATGGWRAATSATPTGTAAATSSSSAASSAPTGSTCYARSRPLRRPGVSRARHRAARLRFELGDLALHRHTPRLYEPAHPVIALTST